MRTTVSVLAVLVTGSLAGCSGNSDSRTSPPPTVTTPAAVTPSRSTGPTPAPAAAPAQSAVSAEKNPPGDIPDNLAFVAYANTAGRYTFTHPEGWAQTGAGSRVLFTDKLNGVDVGPGTATTPPTPDTARTASVPALQHSQPAFELRSITAATMPAGSGVLVVYRRNSAPDAVTGRQYRDEVQRYELVRAGHEVVMELFGPVGADNVDAYRTMVQSLRLQ